MAKQLARYDNYHSLATISADGTQALVLFTNYPESYPTVINITTGAEIARLGEHFVPAYFRPDAMSLSPDGMTAVVGYNEAWRNMGERGYDYYLIIWDVLGNQSTKIKMNLGIIAFLWLDNSQFVALTRAEVTIFTVKGEIVKSFKIKEYGGGSITRHADGMAIYGDKQLHLLNSAWQVKKTLRIGDTLKYRFPGFCIPPCFLSYDARHVALITKKHSNTLEVWDVQRNKRVTKVVGEEEIITATWLQNTVLMYAEFIPDGGKSRLIVWDISTGESTEFVRVQGEVNHIIVRENKIFVSTNDAGVITVWDAESDLINGISQ